MFFVWFVLAIIDRVFVFFLAFVLLTIVGSFKLFLSCFLFFCFLLQEPIREIGVYTYMVWF